MLLVWWQLAKITEYLCLFGGKILYSLASVLNELLSFKKAVL